MFSQHTHPITPYTPLTPYPPSTPSTPTVPGRPLSPSNDLLGDSPGLRSKYDPQQELEQALGGLQSFLHDNINSQEREGEGDGEGEGGAEGGRYGGGGSGRQEDMRNNGSSPQWSRGAVGRVSVSYFLLSPF